MCKREREKERRNGRTTTKTTGCVNLCTQRATCDSNTERSFRLRTLFLLLLLSSLFLFCRLRILARDWRICEIAREDRECHKSQAARTRCVCLLVDSVLLAPSFTLRKRAGGGGCMKKRQKKDESQHDGDEKKDDEEREQKSRERERDNSRVRDAATERGNLGVSSRTSCLSFA